MQNIIHECPLGKQDACPACKLSDLAMSWLWTCVMAFVNTILFLHMKYASVHVLVDRTPFKYHTFHTHTHNLAWEKICEHHKYSAM